VIFESPRHLRHGDRPDCRLDVNIYTITLKGGVVGTAKALASPETLMAAYAMHVEAGHIYWTNMGFRSQGLPLRWRSSPCVVR
jgi:hypothetical protein